MQTTVKSELIEPRLQRPLEDLQFALRVLELTLLNGSVRVLLLDGLLKRLHAICELQIPLAQRLMPRKRQQIEMNQQQMRVRTPYYLSLCAHEEALLNLLGIIAVGNGLELELLLVGLNAIDLSGLKALSVAI